MNCETIDARLSEAETALHELNLGVLEVEMQFDGRKVKFSEASVDKLSRYVQQLRDEKACCQGGRSGRRPIYASF